MDAASFESHYPDTAREEEIAAIASFVQKGSSCQLLGIPGVGRATVLSLLINNKTIRQKHFGTNNQTYHFVSVNFAEIRSRPLFDVMKLLFLDLTESLREEKKMEDNQAVGDIFREHLKFQDELVLFQGFKEAIDYLCRDRQITVVFLFDRFEEYIPAVTAEFFANLRALRNRAKYKFSVVFSLYRPLEMALEPAILSDFYEFVGGNTIYLRPFDSITTRFRVGYIEKITRKRVEKDVLNEIFILTGGIGKLVKLAIESVLTHGTPQHLASFLLEQQTMQAALREIMFSLTPAEQTALKTGRGATEMYLIDSGLIKDGTVQIPLLAAFFKDSNDDAQKTHGQIVYDEATNSIKMGDDLLSDQLTASEFRLLRFFAQNPERVVEREELIDAVWGDNKSTAGITDQAIDQLIFRLRRKIEEDTNNPTHLQTVKGRGFTFVS
ncbi:MAG TPA: helix-turn-helix domain-containing protein [Patescibacteria group bacterium]|nr:helix-turn-helix domain-containing protein [Patescibacteria group bacterium]